MPPLRNLDDLTSTELKALVLELLAEVAGLKEVVAQQRTEIARLKGPPTVKPSGMEKASEAKPSGGKKRRGRGRKRVRIEEQVVKAAVPAGSRLGVTRAISSRIWCCNRSPSAFGASECGVGYIKAMRSPDTRSSAGWRRKRISVGGCARSPTSTPHGTTGERPIERFTRAEAAALRRIDGRLPFRQIRELVRRVQADGTIELDTSAYSAPWRLIARRSRWSVAGGRLSIHHRGVEIAGHDETAGRRQGVAVPAQLAGIGQRQPEKPASSGPELLRPLSEYERAAGDGW